MCSIMSLHDGGDKWGEDHISDIQYVHKGYQVLQGILKTIFFCLKSSGVCLNLNDIFIFLVGK